MNAAPPEICRHPIEAGNNDRLLDGPERKKPSLGAAQVLQVFSQYIQVAQSVTSVLLRETIGANPPIS